MLCLFLSQVQTGKHIAPPRAVVYSEPKAGKTTLIASIPGIVIVPLEDGQGTLDYARTPQPADYETLVETLTELAESDHEYKAVGIDGLTGVHDLIQEYVIRTKMDGSEEKYWAYFRGPRQSEFVWVDFFKRCDVVRRRGVSIWCAAHSKVETIDDVAAGSYTRVMPDLDKYGLSAMTKWSDIIGHLEIERFAQDKGSKESQKKTRTARTTGVRQLIVEDTGSHMAGNRYGLESPIEIPEDNPYSAVRDALRAAVAPKSNEPNSDEESA